MLSAAYAAPTVRKISNTAIRIYGFSLYPPDITHIKFEYNYMFTHKTYIITEFFQKKNGGWLVNSIFNSEAHR